MKNFLELTAVALAARYVLLALCSAPVSSAPVEPGRASSSSYSSSQGLRLDAVDAVPAAGKERTGMFVSGQKSRIAAAAAAGKKVSPGSQGSTPRPPAVLTRRRSSPTGVSTKPAGVTSKFLLAAGLIASALVIFSRLDRALPEEDTVAAGASPGFPSQKLGLGLVTVVLLVTLGLAVAHPVPLSSGQGQRPGEGPAEGMPSVDTQDNKVIIGNSWGTKKGSEPGLIEAISFNFRGTEFCLHPTQRTKRQLKYAKLHELMRALNHHPPTAIDEHLVEWGINPKRNGDAAIRGDHFAARPYAKFDSWKVDETTYDLFIPADLVPVINASSRWGAQVDLYNLLHTASREFQKLL
ncbi:hypothetical protein CSUI_007910 [Cystoisospora suis]|uniref:Transmembrane protein n=1 Tax=Cystoisospora suis TaxID=483139 RepID=A0A2C6KPE0_9APIC|nr:hypothetical protein CSUI_007910 [Cystoisospora suis]